ncbi:MAG: ABC transporter permease [Verrucomicrobia bacterium]|nr:ABC transporter permease [Verrucomicrobiota bacterium]
MSGAVRTAPAPRTAIPREASVTAVLLLLLTVMAIWAPGFFEPQPLLSRLTAAAPRLIVACGIAVVMLTRQIDISVGSLFALCSVAAGLCAARGMPPALAFGVAVALGGAGGALNGFLVAGLRLPSIVVTLATMVTWREALRLARQGVFINLPDGIQWFGLSMASGQWMVCGTALLVLVGMAWGLRHLAVGRHLYAVGSDAEAARLAGLNPRRLTFGALVLLGALTGLAAVLNLVQSPQVDPATGRSLELEAIAAAVVGGIAVSGGRGSLWGVFAGFLLLTCIGPALTYLGVKPYWDRAIQGLVILLAILAEGLRRRRNRP